MQTTLYNINTNQLLGKFREGWYKVDGVKPQLEDHIVELVVTATEPDYNPATHKAESIWEADLVEMQWKQVWSYTEKTAYELECEKWHHHTAHRIILPSMLLYAPAPEGLPPFSVIGLHLMIRNLQMVEEGETIYVYCNEIDPAHEALVTALQGIITIENYPDEEDFE